MAVKDKCDICGEWKPNCRSHDRFIVCEDCRNKHHGKYELEEPEQLSIDEFLGGETNE